MPLLPPPPPPARTPTAHPRPPHAATIESVSITAIDFASAPAWQASKGSSCTAIPNGNRLLGSLR